MKQSYTYAFTKTVTGKVSVQALSAEEAEQLAAELVEDVRNADGYEEGTAETVHLDFLDIDHPNQDDHEPA